MAVKKAVKKAAAKAKATKKPVQSKAKKAAAPKPGDTTERTFKGKTYRLRATDEGFALGKKVYPSLTAAARAITGYTSISGPRFFGLVQGKTKGGAK